MCLFNIFFNSGFLGWFSWVEESNGFFYGVIVSVIYKAFFLLNFIEIVFNK